MISLHKYILTDADIDYINNMESVINLKTKFNNSNSRIMKVNVALPIDMIHKINNTFNIEVTTVPITIIKGNTAPHIDTGNLLFDYTYLIYITDSSGELVLDDKPYLIEKNTGFKFSEGIRHETINTGDSIRMLIGPMDNYGNAVGFPQGIIYYETLEMAQTEPDFWENRLGYGHNYTLELNVVDRNNNPLTFVNGIRWKINDIVGDINIGDFSNFSYFAGDEIDTFIEDGGNYSAYRVYPFEYTAGEICFVAGTPITTDQGIIEIDKIDITKHTINKKPIVAITKTISKEEFLVTFKKDSLGKNCPTKKVTVSETHKVLHNGELKKAITLVDNHKIKKKPYKGEFLYNILLDTYSVVNVNGMTCETLDPKNEIAQTYINKK